MIYNFNVPVLTLEGAPMKEQYLDKDGKPNEREITVGKLVGAQLATSNDEDPLKMIALAKKIYGAEPFEMDESDRQKVESFIKSNKQLINLVRAQALEVLSNPVK